MTQTPYGCASRMKTMGGAIEEQIPDPSCVIALADRSSFGRTGVRRVGCAPTTWVSGADFEALTLRGWWGGYRRQIS